MSSIVALAPFRALDENGTPVAGALATFFLAGTSTPATVYSDEAETVAHASPLVADASGVFPAVYRSGVALKVVLTDAASAALPGSPLDPVAIVSSTGGSAASVAFSATAGVPETDVQAAIERVQSNITDQLQSVGDGSAAEPSLAFQADTDTGFYRKGSGSASYSANGTEVANLSAAGIAALAGSAAAPAWAFIADPDTGIYRKASDSLSVAAGGAEALNIAATGIGLPDGSASVPAVGALADANTGLYFPAADQVALTAGGTQQLLATATQLTSAQPVAVPSGSAAAPALLFSADTDTGLFLESAGVMGFASGGVKQFAFNDVGEVYLTTLTASDSSELVFTGFDATKYTGYVFRCYNLLPATDGASLRWRASTDGGSSYLAGTTYSYAFAVANDDSADSSLKSTGDSSVRVSGNLGNDTNESGYTGALELFGPDRTQYKTLTQLAGYVNSAGDSRGIQGAALIRTNTAVNAVRFFMETGAPAETNIASGEILVFGVRGV